MERMRSMAPWQVIIISMMLLVAVAIGGYFLITKLTEQAPPQKAESSIPSGLDGTKATVDTLQKEFNEPQNQPLVTKPIVTPDPNAPSTVNPFRP